ncbi:MAG: tRNA 2-thiouridine(34) synthase MnmA [Actinomycetota bacterium]
MRSKGSVLVAMSGGVDSSVAACLLAEQGYDVVGSHMRLVHLDGVEHGCCGPAARADAQAVARIGGFPFEIAEMTKEFEERVIGDFTREHEAGRTPNPCARCNGEIKFGAFLRRADELSIDAVATGHYVRSRRDAGGRWHLMRGADAAKDQSYMLHMLDQSQLERSLFPIGEMPKAETRAHAARLGLPVATKPDSQELCFAPSGDAGGFVRTSVPELVRTGGEVVDADGRVVGEHDGTFAFTVGQRRGLGVALGRKAYVIDVDARANRVTVGAAELLSRRGLVADRASWVAGRPPAEEPFEAQVRIRYRGDDAAAEIAPSRGGFTATFHSPQRAIAPGQGAVVYRGDELLGGGRIVSSFR